MRNQNIKHLIISITAVLVFIQPAHGVALFGITDCGQWVKESKSNGAMRTWLIGFMSGLSVMHDFNNNKDDPLKKINSAQQIYLWMDNYCQTNPLKDVSDGGSNLFIELMKK